ncbi:MAG: type II toxin-antitoxin system VapC family toxin [Pirellulales bacterium]|nr:type II toxin-antitoxin system VapC family toxin [Pirellulales bacterium]
MSAAFIIDCSITMAWCFTDERTPATVLVRDRSERETALAPGLWYLEVANVLSLAEKRGRITPALVAEFINLLAKMTIEIDGEGPDRAFQQILPLCRQHDLTSYDAVYLELAIRTGLPLATLDGQLRAAAAERGVPLLGV